MTLVRLTEKTGGCEAVAGRAQVEWKISTLPGFPESVNSESSNVTRAPLAFPCFMANTLYVGKFLPCWNQLGFRFSFPFFFL